MKGPKIENIRDPKWIGKKVTQSNYSFGEGRYFEIKGCNEHVIFGVNFKYGEDLGWQSYSKADDWHEWIEPEEKKKPKLPFKVGDRIRRKSWKKGEWGEVRVICPETNYFGLVFPEREYEEYPKEWYDILAGGVESWELYQEPKKKKTVTFALVRNSKDSFLLSELAYAVDSENAKIIKQHPNTIQFPAVTKDGTVLEFEVEDE